jgi:hypothetical protein
MRNPGRMICHGCNEDLGTSGYVEDAVLGSTRVRAAWAWTARSRSRCPGTLDVAVVHGVAPASWRSSASTTV